MALTKEEKDTLLKTLEKRFEQNPRRHPGIAWNDMAARLEDQPEKLEVIFRMEESGGEPDLVYCKDKKDTYQFFDCSPESPKGRRSLCFDQQALLSRKKFPPSGNAEDLAREIGIRLLDEKQYRFLQTLGEFDLKTSSWIATPDAIRKLGGALFCDRRFDHVFTYHNGAESYYGARGFRGYLDI